MPELVITPAVGATKPKDIEPGPFCQTIRLMEGTKVIGEARWVTSTNADEGVAQVIYLWILPEYGRKGHGRRLMDTVASEARKFYASRGAKPRRLWLAVEQKQQVNARGFLMKFTFHHVGTVKELFKDEDLLIYMRTFD